MLSTDSVVGVESAVLLFYYLRVCKSSTSGSSDTTISTPRLIVVEVRAIFLLGVGLFLVTTKPEKGGSVAILE